MPWSLPSWNTVNAGVEAALAATGTTSSKWKALQSHVGTLQSHVEKFDTLRNVWNETQSSNNPLMNQCYDLCKGIRNNESKDVLLTKVDNIRTGINNM